MKNKNKNLGSYGEFDICHPNSTCMSSGHFWGDKSEVTDDILLTKLIKLIKEYKQRENWTDEWYDTQLIRNLKVNGMYDLYQQTYLKRKERKDKLNKINDI